MIVALAADWLDSTISLIRKAWSQAHQSRSSSREIAMVDPLHDEPGWYRVQGKLSANEQEFISEGSLAYGSRDHAVSFDVLEVTVDDDQVRVRASTAAPREKLSLSIRNTDLRQVLEGLGKGLKASQSNPLLMQFGERRLTPVQPDSRLAQAHGWQSLRPAQQEAVAACCSAGLQLVWGPPGTGKTLVIATAISHLVAAGQRVLLVSNNNIAVDNALYEALRILRTDGDGQAIRIGNISLPALEANQRVRLDRLVEARQGKQQARVDDLARLLEELDRVGADLADSERLLEGFDTEAYQLAAARVDNLRRCDEMTEAQGPAEAYLSRARAELRVHEQLLLSLACCEAEDREEEVQRNLDAVNAALTARRETSLMARSLRPGLKGKLTANRISLENELAGAASARRRATAAARQAGADPAPSIRPDAGQAAAAAERARRDLASADADLKGLKAEIARLTQAGMADPADEDLVITEEQRWTLNGNLPDLRKHAQEAQGRHGIVRQEFDEAIKRMHQEKRIIEREIISGAQLVATTLTQLTLRPAITQAEFAYVIIDEAAAAQLPHLAHAVGYARTGATLVGDYLQNGPIVDRSFPGGGEVRQLFGTDCFTFFDAVDPVRAQRTAGCVVLTEQFRFGPALTELANLVAYRGILTTAGRGDADIVVVTVDGLPEDIRTIHRETPQAGWWLIGALLARALAEFHNDAGAQDAFGVVVPYLAQQRATQAALDDSSLARATPVGTSHRFQGRQFTIVLADLVEDGEGRMAKAELPGSGFAAESARLFNVAATRPRSRLYVLVGRGVLEQAKNGPLAALRSMISAGRASRVDADALLGMFGVVPPPPDTPEADLVAALEPFVRVTGIHDEDAAIDEVIARIDGARSSVWCWSAWIGRYAEDVIDALCRAQQRGVSVHLMTRPEAEVQGSNQDSLRSLVTRVSRVIFMQHMHQKIVVVDRQWSIVGSLNALSHGSTSAKRIRDVMVTMDGASFASQLLSQELAEELSRSRHCPDCSQALVECGLVSGGSDRGWAWICTADRAHRLKFPSLGSRSGQRRNDGRRT